MGGQVKGGTATHSLVSQKQRTEKGKLNKTPNYFHLIPFSCFLLLLVATYSTSKHFTIQLILLRTYLAYTILLGAMEITAISLPSKKSCLPLWGHSGSRNLGQLEDTGNTPRGSMLWSEWELPHRLLFDHHPLVPLSGEVGAYWDRYVTGGKFSD